MCGTEIIENSDVRPKRIVTDSASLRQLGTEYGAWSDFDTSIGFGHSNDNVLELDNRGLLHCEDGPAILSQSLFCSIKVLSLVKIACLLKGSFSRQKLRRKELIYSSMTYRFMTTHTLS